MNSESKNTSHEMMRTFTGIAVFFIFFFPATFVWSQGYVIDHTCVDVNDNVIPEQYLDLVRDMDILFNHQSVGNNILEGFEYLDNSLPDRYEVNLHSGTDSQVPSTDWYLYNNGFGDFREGSNGHPDEKIEAFDNIIRGNVGWSEFGDAVDVAFQKFCFVDDEPDAETIWNAYRPVMESLEQDYSEVTFVWFTMPILTSGGTVRAAYNELVRDYCVSNNKILFDIADIESHDPDGNPIDRYGVEALWSGYASDNGHLNSTGQRRMARAMWWLFARIAGWEPQGGGANTDICNLISNDFGMGLSIFSTAGDWIVEAHEDYDIDWQYGYFYISDVNLDNLSGLSYIMNLRMDTAEEAGAIPVVTFYRLLNLSEEVGGYTSGTEAERVQLGLQDHDVMYDYFENFKQVLLVMNQRQNPGILHIEPDSWGFMMWAMDVEGNDDATSISVDVDASHHPDADGFSNHAGGLGQALIFMRDRYAPNVPMGWHASNFRVGTQPDVVTEFFSNMGDWDVIFTEPPHMVSEGDSWCEAWDESPGGRVETNLNWFETVSENTGLPILIWQTFIGEDYHYFGDWPDSQDNLTRLANAGAAGMMFEHLGSGDPDDFTGYSQSSPCHNTGGTASDMRDRLEDYMNHPLQLPSDSPCGEGGTTNSGRLQFVSADYSVDEGGGTISISVARSGGSDGAASVYYSTNDETAEAGADYTESSGTLSWIDGQSGAQSLQVSILQDNTAEGSEEFTVALSNNVGADLGSLASATVVIADDDMQSLEIQVSQDNDDAEESESGSVSRTSSDLELVEDGSRGDQIVGMRFRNVTIPQNATIQNAYIQFFVDESGSGAVELTIHGEATNSASGFRTNSHDISDRDATTASVSWEPPAWTDGESGSDQRTPNLSAIIQEIVSRSGWDTGNALAIIISGTGKRTAVSHNGNSNHAPILHVEYTEGDAEPSFSISPTQGDQNEQITIMVTGQNTHFDGNSEFDLINGQQTISATSIDVDSETSMSVELSIPANAETGDWDAGVTTGTDGDLTAGNNFTVNTAAITGLDATGIDVDEIDLSWTNQSGSQTHIRIERKQSGSFSQIARISGSRTDYQDANLSDGVQYCYRLIAEDSGNLSDYSDESCATTETSTTPELVSVTPGSASQGQTVTLTVAGSNTHFQDSPQLSLSRGGSDIDADNVHANSDESLTGSLAIPEDADTGQWDVFVTTNTDGQLILNQGVTIESGSSLGWPGAPNTYSWDGSWNPSSGDIPPDELFDDVYNDGHIVDGEPSPILPPGAWDWNTAELATWRGFRNNVGYFDPLIDGQGNQFGWRLIANNPDEVEMTSTSYEGSDGLDIFDFGEDGSLHSTASIQFQDGPDMVRYARSWSIGWRTGSDIDGYENDNDLVIAGYEPIQSPGEFPIQTSGVHTGPGNDLVFMKDMTRSMVDLGNGDDGRTDSIDPHDGDDIIVADGNWLDNRVMGGGGDDIFFWYVDNNRPDNSWTGGRFLGTGSFGDAIWGDDTDRFVLIIPDDTEVVNGHGSLDPGTIQIWQKDPYPSNVIDPPTANDPMARYHSYHTGPGGRRMVTFNYKRITDDYYTGYMNMASIEELQIGVGPNAKVYDINDVDGTATYNPSLTPIYEHEIPSREYYNNLMDSFAPTPPIPDFEADLINVSNCGGEPQTISFTDLTASSPESWQWSFNPSTVTYVSNTGPTSQNPSVQFDGVGYYTVSLTAGNEYGDNTVTQTNYITVSSGEQLPIDEDFESFPVPSIPGDFPTWGPYEWELTNGWTNDEDNETDWIPWRGGTDTNYTGPESGYDSGNDVYMYIESSGAGNRNNRARLLSPCLDLTHIENPSLTFAYHMYGNDVERLQVHIFSNGSWERVFNESGDDVQEWFDEQVDLSDYEGETIRIRFTGDTGDGSQGDVAIDAVRVTGDVVENPGEIRFTAVDYTAIEGDENATITLIREGGNLGAASVTLTTGNGSATSGSDYTAVSAMVEWESGVVGERTVSIPILQDSDIEGSETVNLELSGAVGSALSAPWDAVLTIDDDDGLRTFQIQVRHGNDDAEENLSNGSVNLTSTDLELTEDGGATQRVGIRFEDVELPQNADIYYAHIQFAADETSDDETELTLYGEAVGNSSRFSSSQYDVTDRALTDAAVSWNPPEWDSRGEEGADQRTSDISSIIQEIVNRGDWESLGSLTILIDGSGSRVAESYNGDGNPPLLYVEYAEGGGQTGDPSISITPTSAEQSETVTLIVSGQNTSFDGNTQVVLRNGSQTVIGTNIDVSGGTEMTADLVIPADAEVGAWEVVVSELTPDEVFTIHLGSPVNLTAVDTTMNQIRLTWTSQSETQSHIKIERMEYGDYVQIAQIAGNRVFYTNYHLDSESQYCYRIRAYDGQSNSNYSNELCVETLPVPLPTVTEISPESGPIGTVVTITGYYFEDATEAIFGGVTAVDFTVNSDTRITATVPENATTGVVTVTSSSGTSTGPVFTVITLEDPCNCDPLPAPGNDETVVTVATTTELINAVTDADGPTTVYLQSGVYPITENEFIVVHNPNISIRSLSGNRDDVTIQGPGIDAASGHGIQIFASHVTVADLTIRDVGYHAIQVQPDNGASNLLFHNIRCVDTGQQIFKSSGTEDPPKQNGIIECSVFEYTTTLDQGNYTNGIDILNSDNWIIRDNVARNIKAAPGSALAGPAILAWHGCSGTIVERNRIIDCDFGISFGNAGGSGVQHEGGIIRNNFIKGHSSSDFGVGLVRAQGATVVYNTIYSPQAWPYSIEARFSETTECVIENNLTDEPIWRDREGASASVSDNYTDAYSGMFLDYEIGDLHLASEELPAINAGSTTSDRLQDIDCDAVFDGQPDIGADEFTGLTPSVVSVSPTHIEQDQQVTITVVGSAAHFLSAGEFHLTQGSTTLTPDNISLISNSEMLGQLTVPDSAPVGDWNVISSNDLDGTLTLSQGFEIRLGAPDDLDAQTVSATAIDLIWQNHSATQTHVRIQRRMGQTGSFATIDDAESDATSYSDSDLNPDTEYCYRVQGFDDQDHVSTYSDVSCATTETSSLPTIVSVTPGNGKQDQTVTLTIVGQGTHFDNESEPSLDYGQWAVQANSITVQGDTELDAVFILPPNAEVGFWEVTVETETDGEISFPDGFFVNLGAPSNLQAVSSSGDRVDLSWVNHSSTQTALILERETQTQGAGSRNARAFEEIAIISPTETSYSDVSLQENSQYCYRLQARQGSDILSEYSNQECVVTQSNPTLLTGVEPSYAEQDQSITLILSGQNTHFADASATPIVGLIRGNQVIQAERVDVTVNTLLTAELTLPTDAPTGSWDVVVQNEIDGPLSIDDGFEILLGSPSDLVVSPNNSDALQLRWITHSETQIGVAIERRPGQSGVFSMIGVVEGGAAVFIDEAVDPAIEYCYRVQGFDSEENSSYCREDCSIADIISAPLWIELINLETSEFPIIYAHVNVFNNGVPLLNLNESHFQAFEDGGLQSDLFGVTPPDVNQNQRIADVVFVIDNSGSMGEEQEGIGNNLSDFAQSMEQSGVDFRFGLVRYGTIANGGCPIIEDDGNLTSDMDYFVGDVWDRNVTVGSNAVEEPSYHACVVAAQDMNFRPGAQKMIILVTDEANYPENCDGHVYSREECISLINAAGATIYGVTRENYGSCDYDYVDPDAITYATGGQWYNIYDSGGFDPILTEIGETASHTYVIRYRTDHPTPTDQNRHVEITVNYSGRSEIDDGWYNPALIPNMTLTDGSEAMNESAQPPGTPVEISVELVGGEETTLFYRSVSGQGAYNEALMSHSARSNTYSAMIPAEEMTYPGVQYYIRASSDNATITLPSTDPASYPFNFSVMPNQVPDIDHTRIAYAELGAPLSISAVVNDDGPALSPQGVELLYRHEGDLSYTLLEMQPDSERDGSYQAEIPGDAMTESVEYYIRATDNHGLISTVASPDTPYLIDASITTVSGSIYRSETPPANQPIVDIVVQAWDSYPNGQIVARDTTDSQGLYELYGLVQNIEYDLRAHSLSNGSESGGNYPYFPEIIRSISTPASEVDFSLQASPTVAPTNIFCQFYCIDSSEYEDQLLHAGDVVVATDAQGVVCGKSFTSGEPNPGGYSIFVYGDDPYTDQDEGMQDGERISFSINGLPADAIEGNPVWHDRLVEPLCLSTTASPTVMIPLTDSGAGWNLISWNVETPNDSVQVIFEDVMPNVEAIMGYEGGSLTYRPSLPLGFSNLRVTDHLHGYWVKMNQADTLWVSGVTASAYTPVELNPGWNLVGYQPFPPDSTYHAIASIIAHTDAVLGFDPILSPNNPAQSFRPDLIQFSNLKIMRQKYGYWVRVDAADTLIYPETALSIPLDQLAMSQIAEVFYDGSNSVRNDSCFLPDVTPTNQWIEIYGEDLTLNEQPLPTGARIIAYDAEGVACGAFEVHTAGQFGLMAIYGDDAYTEVDEGPQPGEPVELYICHPDYEDSWQISGDLIWTSFGDIVEIHFDLVSIDDPSTDNFPKEFALHQNYPNPFNPWTAIRFELPIPGKVTLQVYNAAGQLVRTLTDREDYEAGRHTARWMGKNDNGQAISSGVYFYRLKAGKFEATRKMVLIR